MSALVEKLMSAALRHLVLAMLLVTACSDSSGGGTGGAGGDTASTTTEASSSSGAPGPCDGYDGESALSDDCSDWMIEYCASLTREECVATVPLGGALLVGCALVGVASEEKNCQATEPYQCIAALDPGDSGFHPWFLGSDVLAVVCDDGRDFCPSSLLVGEACSGTAGPGYCNCGPEPE